MSQIIADAKKRIQDIRKKDLEVVVFKDGQPVSDASVKLSMKNHQFLFGCNAFRALSYEDPGMTQRYHDLFTGILNYATLPFYWGRYEPTRGVTEEADRRNLLEWCRQNGLKTKGHPLLWHEVAPTWLTEEDDLEALFRKRVKEIFAAFGPDIDFWDVFNETTAAFRFINPVTRWIFKKGKANAVKFAVDAVREVYPAANLLYNDYYIFEKDCDVLLDELRRKNVELAAVGLQSHQHTFRWTLEETWEMCERYARFGWPLHFTENSILSGHFVGRSITHESKFEDWSRSPEELISQAESSRDFYTMLFSHPQVEAITWWDLMDNAWRTAPAGIVTDDLYAKPVYNELKKLIKEEWWSDESGKTNLEGVFKANAFAGTYDLEVAAGDKKATVEFNLTRDRYTRETQKLVVTL